MGSKWIETPYGQFSADFCVDRLFNLCDANQGIQTGPFGSQLHQEDYVQIGTPIITVEHLGENRILHANTPKVSDDDRNRLSRYRLNKGDIVFSRVGSVDRRALVREKEEGWLFSGRCLRVRPDPKKIDSQFLSYFFGLPAFKEHIRAIAVGATMPSLNTSLLSEIAVPHPSNIDEQRAIAHILGTLDDKIELGRKQNETLEAMARALFKAWFVDFEPVRAKIEGRWQRGQSLPGLSAHLYDIFPDRLVDSELGEIPEGWDVVALGELVETVKGRSYKSEELVESDTALVTLKSFARGGGYRPDGLKPFAGTYKVEQVVHPGEVVVACTDVTQAAEVIGRPAIVRRSTRYQRLVASLDTLIVRPKDSRITRAFLYFLGGTEAFVSHTYAHTTGTTVLHLGRDAVPSFTFARPPAQLVQKFDALAASVLERIQATEQESETLAQLRDTLLPKLISGALRIKDAEAFLQERGL